MHQAHRKAAEHDPLAAEAHRTARGAKRESGFHRGRLACGTSAGVLQTTPRNSPGSPKQVGGNGKL